MYDHKGRGRETSQSRTVSRGGGQQCAGVPSKDQAKERIIKEVGKYEHLYNSSSKL